MARNEFFGSIWPAVMQASKSTGVDPRIIAAQAALESNYGRSAPGNNLFGIKSHGQSGGNSLMTTEVINGKPVRVRDSFRSYASPAESVDGYVDFINSNKRYRPFREAQGLDAQISALGRSGYATDPQYAAKIRSIATGIPVSSQVASREPSPPQAPGTPAPPLHSTTLADQPVATLQAESPPGSLFALLGGGDKAKSGGNSMLEMLMAAGQPPEAPSPPQMPQQPQGPTLADLITQFMQSRQV